MPQVPFNNAKAVWRASFIRSEWLFSRRIIFASNAKAVVMCCTLSHATHMPLINPTFYLSFRFCHPASLKTFPRGLNRTTTLVFYSTSRSISISAQPIKESPFQIIFKRMASTSAPDLPIVQGTDPSKSVFDSFRIAIAKRLSESLPLSLEQAYAGIDYGKKGEDFTVAVPRYRLPGKVDEIAAKVLEKV